MSRPEGLQKTGGRKRGTPNKKTQELEEILGQLDINIPTEIIKLLPSLAPEKRVDTLMELMNFLYPKRKAVEHTQLEDRPIETPKVSKEELKARVLKLREQNDLTLDE